MIYLIRSNEGGNFQVTLHYLLSKFEKILNSFICKFHQTRIWNAIICGISSMGQ